MKVDIPENILEQVEDVKGIGKGATKVQRATLAKEIIKELNEVHYFAGDIDERNDEERRYIRALESVADGIGFHVEAFLED